MGYHLIDGKRYYRYNNGNLWLDNVSQEEADRRERENALLLQANNSANHEISVHTSSRGYNTSTHSHRSIPWGTIIIVLIVIMVVGAVVGAFVFNQSHRSPSEKTIIDYMENLEGTTELLTKCMAELGAEQKDYIKYL